MRPEKRTKASQAALAYGVLIVLAFKFDSVLGQESSNRFSFGQTEPIQDSNSIQQEPTYFVLAAKSIRPGQVYRVSSTVYRTDFPITVRAAIQRNGVEVTSASEQCSPGIPETLLLQVPTTSLPGSYKLRVEGNLNSALGGTAFLNETDLEFSQRSMTIFITTDIPVYMQGQVVYFRCVPVTTDLKAFTDSIDVYMYNPQGLVMRRWLSVQSNLGAVSLEYSLSEQPVYGNWTIKVIAQGQEERKHFLVEEFCTFLFVTHFHLNLTEEQTCVSCEIQLNTYLTILLLVLDSTRFEVNVSMPTFFMETDEYIEGTVISEFSSGVGVVGNLSLFATVEQFNPLGGVVDVSPARLDYNMELFEGYTEFRFEMSALSKLIGGSSLDGAKVTVNGYVGERFLNLVYHGYARTYIFGSKIKLNFLGSSPQVFKPYMPFKTYVAISFNDGSPLPETGGFSKYLDISARVYLTGRQQALPIVRETMSPSFPGIWEISFNLKEYFRDKKVLAEVSKVRLQAIYTNLDGSSTSTTVDLYSTYSPSNRLIQVSTSTKQPKVGEYIILDVRANYYVEMFSYAVLSKGMILLTGREEMSSSIMTFAITLSSEMAPSSTIVIYDIARGGDVIADSLTFPVDGISRNNFTVTLNSNKDKSGDSLEVVVFGQPGTYVGLSAMDLDLHALDANNQIDHSVVLKKMSTFDQQSNGTLNHLWISRDGESDQFLNFASPSFGIDMNRTFEYAGLVVFTDGNITRRPEVCNTTIGFVSCLDGRQCYHLSRRCDGRSDCSDSTDESKCVVAATHDLERFRTYRNSRLQRLYENSWLWRDINIGPLGYFIFTVPLPNAPASWSVLAFGMSTTHGIGLQKVHIPYSVVRPFYISVELPSKCTLGEQIGVRVSIFNNLEFEIEVIVVLANSPDYKFVHVEELGRVSAYSPRTSYGEHQHLVVIRPGTSTVVYVPIVAQVLGDVDVTITVKTQIAKNVATETIHVEADGIPQHLHTSVVIDLSQGAYLIKYLDTNITDTPIIPYRDERRYIFGSNKATVSVVGDVVGPTFQSMPTDASGLLMKPYGCGEQNMFNFAYNMYTLLYLRLTGQRKPEVEKQAFRYLNIMYERQLTFQNNDGGFRAFRWRDRPSVWLTAFCARILHKATFQEWENFLFVDPTIINNAISWILQYQTSEGAFYETSVQPYDRKMDLTTKMFGDNVQYRNISLTAHVLITLTEVRDLRGEVVGRASNARYLAQRYLERMLHLIRTHDDPYELSIVTYALTLSNSVDAEEAFNILDSKMREVSGMRYWSKEQVPAPQTQIENNRPYVLPRLPDKFEAVTVETTAYALMVHIAKQAVIQKEIVEFLNTHRQHNGGWSSTQDSIVAFQAVIEYSIQSRLRDVTDIDITIEAPASEGFEEKVNIGQENLSKLQAFEIPNAYGPVIIKAQGSGLAIIQLDVQYNVDWAHLQVPPPVDAFELEVSMQAHGRNKSHIEFRACQRWTNIQESYSSGLAVLEVTIPTGYVIHQHDLDSYVLSGSVRNLHEARYAERKVTFYFAYLDTSPICLAFTVQRWYPVANMSRHIPARVYDFYAPERFNETMINAYSLYVLSICDVCGSYQCPYCPLFSASHTKRVDWVLFSTILILGYIGSL
ncbi:Antigen -like protein [Halotydeus destructor]|nr:Antigen -like protein [Halotydeus destructor]